MHAIAMVHKMQRLALSNCPAIQEEEIDQDATGNPPTEAATADADAAADAPAVGAKTQPESAVDMDLSLPQ